MCFWNPALWLADRCWLMAIQIRKLLSTTQEYNAISWSASGCQISVSKSPSRNLGEIRSLLDNYTTRLFLSIRKKCSETTMDERWPWQVFLSWLLKSAKIVHHFQCLHCHYDLQEYWFLANLRSCTLCINSFTQTGYKDNRNSLFLTVLWRYYIWSISEQKMAPQTCAVWLIFYVLGLLFSTFCK